MALEETVIKLGELLKFMTDIREIQSKPKPWTDWDNDIEALKIAIQTIEKILQIEDVIDEANRIYPDGSYHIDTCEAFEMIESIIKEEQK